MEQISSIFSRFKQQISGAGDGRECPRQDQTGYTGPDPQSAPEEDGFLLVGETASDKKMVYAASFNVYGQQAPPTYDQCASSSDTSNSFSMFATCTPASSAQKDIASPESDGHTFSSGHNSAIMGVPFQLNPRLQEKERLSSVLSQMDLQCNCFDWEKYEYDFEFERESLRELSAGNSEKNMDTFTSITSLWQD